MEASPEVVLETFEKLKNKFGFYIILRKINNHFYVYKATTEWDKERKIGKTIQTYLGRIDSSGNFLQKIAFNEKNERRNQNQIFNAELTSNEKKLLINLSMNARASLSFLGKKLGLGSSKIYKMKERLENRYGIEYITEIDAEKLGYLKIIIFAKFLDKIPSVAEIKAVLEKEPRVQVAALMKGEYDLMIYALVKNIASEETIDTVVSLSTGSLMKYKAKWYATPLYEHFGYVPVRKEFIEFIKSSLPNREYKVLTELLQDGTIDFTKIDKKYEMNPGASKYTYYKLKEKEVIKRITINMSKLNFKYLGMLLKEFIDVEKFKRNRAKSLMDIIEEVEQPVNKYILGGDMSSPFASVLFMPIFKDGQLEESVNKLSKLDLGINIKTGIITSVLLGSFCYRNFDIAYSKQYKILKEVYKLKFPKTEIYSQTGHEKKTHKFTSDIRSKLIEENEPL